MDNVKDLLLKGQVDLSETIKSALYDYDPKIFDKLDFDNDAIYLEPLLFSYFSRKEKNSSLDQILLGYYNDKPNIITVFSNKKGVVYIPKIGSLITDYPSKQLDLKISKGQIELYYEGTNINYKSIQPTVLKSHGDIELTGVIDNLSENYFDDNSAVFKKNNDDLVFDHINAIEKALNIIKTQSSEDYSVYLRTLKRIVLFEDALVRNFATLQCHGTIFIGVNHKSSVSYFIEEIIHQASHIVFNTMTFNVKDFFKIDPYTKCNKYFYELDNRTIYGMFHGLYTTNKILEFFIELVKTGIDEFNSKDQYEIKGRLAINKLRVNYRLKGEEIEEIFTDRGKEMYKSLDGSSRRIIVDHPNLFDFDLAEQGYVFDYETFLKKNPLLT